MDIWVSHTLYMSMSHINDMTTIGPLDHHLKDFDSLCVFGLARVRLVTTSFLCCAHFLTVLHLTALLVAKFKANPELSHLTAREDVRDPLDHKRSGLLLICRAGSCRGVQTAWTRLCRLTSWRYGGWKKNTHLLWGRCGAPSVVWPAADLSWTRLVILVQAEARDSGNVNKSRRRSLQNSERAPEPTGGQTVRWREIRRVKVWV